MDGLIQNIVCFFNADPLILSPLIFFIFAIDLDWFINKKDKNQRIVFFDGICGICNGLVDFLLNVDNYQRLTFSPLQSNFSKETLGDRTLDMDSIIYFR